LSFEKKHQRKTAKKTASERAKVARKEKEKTQKRLGTDLNSNRKKKNLGKKTSNSN